MIISFGWTVAALKAGHKTVTRRTWNADYARRFKKGDLIAAYDRSPRFGGKQVATIRLTCDPIYEPMSDMPNSDYWAEGFGYLNENRHLLPKSMPYDVSLAGFHEWRDDGSNMWVVRFKPVKLL